MKKIKRKHRPHRMTVDENEEKRKMRESILKVFRARAHSPGGGGAVVVNERPKATKNVSTTEVKQSHSLQRSHRARDYSLSSDPEVLEGNGSQRESRQRKRLRRTITGQQNSGYSSKTGVRQHIRAAHSFSYSKSADSMKRKGLDSSSATGCITRSRLTRNIGLFNPGRKSSTIIRDPIPVPESVQRDVDRTLLHILDHHEDLENRSSRERSRSGETEQDLDSDPLSASLTHNEYQNSSSHTPLSAHCVRGSTPQHRQSHHSPAEASGARNSPDKLSSPGPDSTADIPPIEEIAVSMLSELETEYKKNFEDRDLLGETCAELKKLLNLKQRTPEFRARSPHQRSSHSARRSLIDSFSSLDEELHQRRNAEVVGTSPDCSTPDTRPPYESCPERTAIGVPSSLFPTDKGKRSTVVREDTSDKRENSDTMEVHPCRASTLDQVTTDSAIPLLKSNSMVSKISSLYKQEENSVVSVSELGASCSANDSTTHREHSYSLFEGEAECFSSNSRRPERSGNPPEQDTFFKKVMGSSSIHHGGDHHHCCTMEHGFSSSQMSKNMQSESYQQPRHSRSDNSQYYRSQWKPSDMFFGDTLGKESNLCYNGFGKNSVKYSSSHHSVKTGDAFPDSEHGFPVQADSLVEQEANSWCWGIVGRHPKDCDIGETLTPECDDWLLDGKRSHVLPPLQKPSMETPSPPEKMSPHKLY